MSGGSWDYFYSKLQDVAERLQCEHNPLRAAFGSHLKKCAKALKDIEWVDSGDSSKGDEEAAINEALGGAGPALVLDEARKEAVKALEQLKNALTGCKKPAREWCSNCQNEVPFYFKMDGVSVCAFCHKDITP